MSDTSPMPPQEPTHVGADSPATQEGAGPTQGLSAATPWTSAPSLPCGWEHVRVPGYVVLGEVGRGGMGVVYKARHLALNRLVALKMILHAEYADADQIERFRTEAEAVARIQHPHIVQVYDIGEHKGVLYFSLELCPGGSLADRLKGPPASRHRPDEAARLVQALARAVQAAHEARVVHRDLKPANVLLAADGTPKITDFGLAKKLDEQGRTQSGAILGTPSYMAPEQALGKIDTVGPAADTYALGAILYELLTGRPPFVADTLLGTLEQVRFQAPPAVRALRPNCPRDLETICLKCLEKVPGRRYASAAALADDLGRFLAGELVLARRASVAARLGRRARRWGPRVLPAAILLLALGLVGWHYSRPAPVAPAPDGPPAPVVPAPTEGPRLAIVARESAGDAALTVVAKGGPKEGQQIEQVYLWINDHRYQGWDTAGQELSQEVVVPAARLRSGANQLTLQACTRAGTWIEEQALVRGPQRTGAPTLHALLVGVNDYSLSRQGSPATSQLSDLRFTVADGRALEQALRQQKGPLYGNVVTRPLLDREATRRNILAALREVGARAAPDDRLVLYLGGTGVTVQERNRNNFTFCCADYVADRRAETGLSAADVYEALEGIGCFKCVLLDACQSGGMIQHLPATPLPRGQGPSVLASCAKDQYCVELEQLGHGLFTQALLEALGAGLEKADRNNDGLLDLAELFAYAQERSIELNKQYKVTASQTPLKFLPGEQRWPLIARPRPAP